MCKREQKQKPVANLLFDLCVCYLCIDLGTGNIEGGGGKITNYLIIIIILLLLSLES